MAKKEIIRIGSGQLYVTDFDKETGIPENTEIEKEENRIGLIQGGATIEYTQTKYTAKDDLEIVTKSILTSEEVKLKSGVLTWTGNTLAKLCETARVTESENKRTVKIGGIANATGKQHLIRFVHEDMTDGNVRITIVGNNEAGITLAFTKDKETVIDAEFTAQALDNEGTKLIYEEEIPTSDIPSV